MKQKKYYKTKALLRAALITLGTICQGFGQLDMPRGRIAISHDGNRFDDDDYLSSAMNLALLEGTGLSNRLVHYHHSCHLRNDNQMYNQMLTSVNGARARFNFSSSVIFDVQQELDEIIDHFVEEAVKSNANNRLWFLCAGPMEVPWRCINAVPQQFRQFITCVSHSSPFNENHTDSGVGMTHNWNDIGDLGVNQIRIINQNGTGWNGSIGSVSWMQNSSNPDLQWLFDRNVNNSFDASDAGMTWWLITGGPNGGDENGGQADYRPFLESIATSSVVRMRKRNAFSFALDGGNGGGAGQNVYLWHYNFNNVNQQWREINRGNGFYSYEKGGESFSLDGGNGGALRQNLYLWHTQNNNFNQHWRKIGVGGGRFLLQKRNASGFAIDGDQGGAAGQNVYLWDSNTGNQNQQWFFVE